jgi:hypothetical protein
MCDHKITEEGEDAALSIDANPTKKRTFELWTPFSRPNSQRSKPYDSFDEALFPLRESAP